MIRLLNIEWLKIKKYTTFWILVGLFAVLFLSWNYGVSTSIISLGEGPVKLFNNAYGFPQIWSNMSYLYSYFVIFLCVFVIISITNEFSYRTNRQHIIDGMSREDFLHAKALLVVSISISATLFLFICGILFGFLNGGGNPFNEIYRIGYAFIYTLNYLSFAAFIAFFVKRSGLSIIFLLAYFLLEAICSGVMNWQFNSYLGNLLPLQCSDELLPLNALKSLTHMTGSSQPEAPVWLLLTASVIYIILYYFLLRRKMLRTDL